MITMITMIKFTTGLQAVAKAAVMAEDLADSARVEGRSGAMLSHWHRADEYWTVALAGCGNDGAWLDRRA